MLCSSHPDLDVALTSCQHWIWYPPFTGDFVRQQWHEGFEVDTFHTFHWGDVQEDGVWRGDPGLIEDTRDVLRQSAARQGMILSEDLPMPVALDVSRHV